MADPPSRLIRLGEFITIAAIQNGLLEPLLQDVQDPEKYPLWAVMPPGRQQSPKVRAFVDYLIECFGSAPWRQKAFA
jgi:DNA-binding transcriptional LysR family regulator